MTNIRGMKQPAAPRYVARGLQTELEREIVSQEWIDQLPQTYPTLAKTDVTMQVLATFMAPHFWTVEALNNAVEDNKQQLEWLQPVQPAQQPRVMSEVAQREDGSKPIFDLSSRSHTTIDLENKRRDEARKAEIAAKEAAVKAAKQNQPQPKPQPVRQNIGADAGGIGLPGRINHSAGRSSSTEKLKDNYTPSEFKKLPNELKRKFMQLHGTKPLLPEPPKPVEVQ